MNFITESKLKFHKKVCKNKDFCNAVMPSEDSQYKKFAERPFIIYADLECLIEKIDG